MVRETQGSFPGPCDQGSRRWTGRDHCELELLGQLLRHGGLTVGAILTERGGLMPRVFSLSALTFLLFGAGTGSQAFCWYTRSPGLHP